MIAPSNPTSHAQMYEGNMSYINLIIEKSKIYNYEVLIKTYPNDYVFYEQEKQYTGIYHRKKYSIPQYEFLKSKFDDITVIQSQDHHAVVRDSDLIFNMAGSSIAWDTYFTKCKSFTYNFKITDMQSIIALEQLKTVNSRIRKKKQILILSLKYILEKMLYHIFINFA